VRPSSSDAVGPAMSDQIISNCRALGKPRGYVIYAPGIGALGGAFGTVVGSDSAGTAAERRRSGELTSGFDIGPRIPYKAVTIRHCDLG